MTGEGPDPSLRGRSSESGKSRLLVSEALATHPVTGEVAVRHLHRTVLPLPAVFLAGVDNEGNKMAPDMEEVEKELGLYSLLLEYSQTSRYAPEGVYCMPSWEDIRVWDGVILLRHGVYRGGIFKFKIVIGENYPEKPPSLRLLSRVYHALVDPDTGELNLQPQFPVWQSDDYIPMLLMYLKSIFYKKVFLEGGSAEAHWRNVDAAKAFREDKKLLLEEVRKCVEESQTSLYRKLENDFIFNFTEFHREKKPIFHALNVLAHDATCVDPTETFTDWFLDDWSRTEYSGNDDLGLSEGLKPTVAEYQ